MALLEAAKGEWLSKDSIGRVRVLFLHGDFNGAAFDECFRRADVVYYFSFGADPRALARTLVENMRCGSRVVEFGYGLPELESALKEESGSFAVSKAQIRGQPVLTIYIRGPETTTI